MHENKSKKEKINAKRVALFSFALTREAKNGLEKM